MGKISLLFSLSPLFLLLLGFSPHKVFLLKKDGGRGGGEIENNKIVCDKIENWNGDSRRCGTRKQKFQLPPSFLVLLCTHTATLGQIPFFFFFKFPLWSYRIYRLIFFYLNIFLAKRWWNCFCFIFFFFCVCVCEAVSDFPLSLSLDGEWGRKVGGEAIPHTHTHTHTQGNLTNLHRSLALIYHEMRWGGGVGWHLPIPLISRLFSAKKMELHFAWCVVCSSTGADPTRHPLQWEGFRKKSLLERLAGCFLSDLSKNGKKDAHKWHPKCLVGDG